jgi:hypothetical protein
MTDSYNVYAGQDGVINYVTPVATMLLADTSVNITIDMPANTIWHFVRRRVAPCALESADSDVCIVKIDADGDMIPLAPNLPTHLAAEAIAGGDVRLRWRYCTIHQEIVPTAFRIYIDDGSGFDFDTPDASLSYGYGGNGEFSYDLTGLTPGTRYRFCARAYNSTSTGETQNESAVACTPIATGPAAFSAAIAASEEE